jgi:hypothetical protein
MNPIRNTKQMGMVLLAVLAVTLFTGNVSAQQPAPVTQGEFSLPYAAHWGKTVLPAGAYSFRVTANGPTSIVTVRGNKQSAFVMTAGVWPCSACTGSELILINRKGERTVQMLRLAQAGIVLYYGPRREVDEALAQAPEATERVGVKVAAK